MTFWDIGVLSDTVGYGFLTDLVAIKTGRNLSIKKRLEGW
jgi:hypothetical protein